MASLCGADCGECLFSGRCSGCSETCGRPFGGSCVASEFIKEYGFDDYAGFRKNLLLQINSLLSSCGIPEAERLCEMPGFLVNMEYPLQNGGKIKFLNDEAVYLCTQITAGDICYGAVTDSTFVLICSYRENGADPELILYKRI